MSQLADIGVTGLAVMGANLARNAARKGFRVAVHNRSPEKTDRLIADHGKEGKFVPSHSVEDFVASLSKPRAIIIMVKAGKPNDDVIAELVPHLDEGDIVIDAGNALFSDTRWREKALAEKKLLFVGMGVSGGEEGALKAPRSCPAAPRRPGRASRTSSRRLPPRSGRHALLRLGRRKRRRPLRQDGPQRHRIRRHRSDRRSLRPDEGRPTA